MNQPAEQKQDALKLAHLISRAGGLRALVDRVRAREPVGDALDALVPAPDPNAASHLDALTPQVREELDRTAILIAEGRKVAARLDESLLDTDLSQI
jgi:hypothetical protein